MYSVKIARLSSMIYLNTDQTTMKTKSQTIHFAFWMLLGLAISLVSLALNRPLPAVQEATLTPGAQTTETVTAATKAGEDVGSTDGIMLMAVVIVLIVVTPILLRRKDWSNGKGEK